MKNMNFPIDIIFLDENKKISYIYGSVPPCKTANCPTYPPSSKSKYVVETAAGFSKNNGLKIGQAITFKI